MDSSQQNEPTRETRNDAYHIERTKEKKKQAGQRMVRHAVRSALGVVAIAGSIGAFAWYATSRPTMPEGELIARGGLHAHPTLTIFVDGEKREIPANIGLGATHNPLHTHDGSGVVHLEFPGIVLRENVKLGAFFAVWGKDFMEFGPSVRMTVNGEENDGLDSYVMRDGDAIELHYETPA